MMQTWYAMPILGSIFMMLFCVALFVVVLKCLPWQKNKESNLEIATRRYAQGEINAQQLNEIKNKL